MKGKAPRKHSKPASLKSPLSSFMYFGKFKGRVIHFSQEWTTGTREPNVVNASKIDTEQINVRMTGNTDCAIK